MIKRNLTIKNIFFESGENVINKYILTKNVNFRFQQSNRKQHKNKNIHEQNTFVRILNENLSSYIRIRSTDVGQNKVNQFDFHLFLNKNLCKKEKKKKKN